MRGAQDPPSMVKPISLLLRGLLVTDIKDPMSELAGSFARGSWLEPTVVSDGAHRCGECDGVIESRNLAFRSGDMTPPAWLCFKCANEFFAEADGSG